MNYRKKEKRKKSFLELQKFLEYNPDATIDFHEYDIRDENDVKHYLFEFIEECVHLQKSKLLVITGKGKVIKPAVQKFLRQSKYVESFKQAGYFNGQDGAFVVRLKP